MLLAQVNAAMLEASHIARMHSFSIRLQLELTALSYACWHKETAELKSIAAAAENGYTVVDVEDLGRLGAILEAIDEDLQALQRVSKGLVGQLGAQVSSVCDLLTALRNEVRALRHRFERLSSQSPSPLVILDMRQESKQSDLAHRS